MVFQNRKQAAEQLAEHLQEYKNSNAMVLGIPRGGIEIGYYLASSLNAGFSVIVSKRLAYPGHEEYDFGALCEDEIAYIRGKKHEVSDELIRKIMQKSQEEISHSVSFFRKGASLPQLKGKTVIITDDAMATGVTLVPAIRLCRRLEAAKIVIAVPVAAKTFDKNIKEADEVKILHHAESLKSLKTASQTFKKLNDEEALSFLSNYPVSLS
ncbi:MAG: phosphoribosyltransferase [Bacteroidetes bacterium]|nr:phosphoribosyltransferase [Bacteroidota bacterium]